MARFGVLIFGVALMAIGAIVIGFGLAPDALSFGNTLVIAGSVLFGAGAIVAALGVLVRMVHERWPLVAAVPPVVAHEPVTAEAPQGVAPAIAGIAAAAVGAGALAHHALSGEAGAPSTPETPSVTEVAEAVIVEAPVTPEKATSKDSDALFDLDRTLEDMLEEVRGPSDAPHPEPESHRQLADDIAAQLHDDEQALKSTLGVEPAKTDVPHLPAVAAAKAIEPTADLPHQGTHAGEVPLLREGVIASIPFRLYGDGSVIAELAEGDRRFDSLKEFRAFVGG